MKPTETAVSVSGLTRYYGELLAVDHISFEVARGEFFGFLGPNGAGKTTTIRMLTNLLTPSEGEATILGCTVERSALRLRERMGVIPENPNVFDELSSLDNLLFTGELYGMPRGKRRERAAELLARFGLEDRAKSKARELSKGLKRRLSITMGLIHDPDILFLDEPTSGLDVHSDTARPPYGRHSGTSTGRARRCSTPPTT
jgi:ABC-2 type transport system ATP-binding protein